MISRLAEMLTREGVRFDVIGHPEVYTAQERAAACHVTGRTLAKVVVVRDGDWCAMAVLPAARRLDLRHFGRLTGRYGLTLAREVEFSKLFPDCDVGAMPPFGRLWGLDVYLDSALAAAEELVFEGGTHREEIRMPMTDYVRIECPTITSLAEISRAA